MPVPIQKLLTLLPEEVRVEKRGNPSSSEITFITDDSRKANASCIFSASEQGLNFIGDALSKGCSVFLIPGALSVPDSITNSYILHTENFLKIQGLLASAINGNPSESLYLVGITGTNGKTSISQMLYHIWKSEGLRPGVIGTLGVRYLGENGEEKNYMTGYTTPRAGELQFILAAMKNEGVTHVALEASSEALFLGRLEGTQFSSSVFINLTPEHLDFHKNMEDYFQAKMHLFDLTKGSMIVNASGAYGERAAEYAKGISEKRTVVMDAPFVFNIPSPVHFNKINASLAVLSSSEDALSRNFASEALRILPEIPGRFNVVPYDDKSMGIVDYAHTPDALENVLRESRGLGIANLCVVFGCGGNRDSSKRPLMGRAASQYADVIIVTDDNPRKEDPAHIRSQIIEGIPGDFKSSENLFEVPDRREAIRRAAEWLSCQSVPSAVVLAGKGHETVQIFSDRREHFSDAEVIREEFIRLNERVTIK